MNPENDSPLRSQEVRTISLLPSSSVEQNNIVSHLKQGHNVIVDAIAGSGKSTTIITVAKALPNKRFLQLTYNAMLRKEFRQTLEKQHIHNIDVHTFHSLGVRHFTSEACTDMSLRRVLYENLPLSIIILSNIHCRFLNITFNCCFWEIICNVCMNSKERMPDF